MALRAFIHAVDGLNEWLGRAVAWLTLGTVAVCFAVVVMRYFFHIGILWFQELYVWQHAIVFMLGAGYTFLHGGHVRVDVFYAKMDPRRQAWVNLFGTVVFLFPWLIVLFTYSWDYFQFSFGIREPSQQPGGMPAIYLLKAVIPLFCVLVGLQGLSLMARSILVLRGDEDYRPKEASH